MDGVSIRILDCANKGEVKSVTGRRGDIAANAEFTKISGGWFDNNMAAETTPMADGATIYGRVTDNEGAPISNVVVSDGVSCVATDDAGCYALNSNMASTRFVFVSIPDGYGFTERKSVPQMFKRIPRYAKGATANFTLVKRTEPTDKYTVIMIGDPQMRGLGHDESGERFRDVVLTDIEEYRQRTTGEFFAINLGDLVYNWMAGYDDYMDISASAKYPIFNVIGNHDYDQATLFETKLGTPFFEEYVSPTYYSFNIGKMHFVVVNSILYDRPTDKHNYKTGLDNKTLKWLENDLAHVSKETPIVICSHAPLFKRREAKINYNEKSVNYKKYTALLSKYDKVYAWAGHTHQNYATNYANEPEKYSSLKNIESVIVGRCIGMIRLNRELNTCGTPNGYMVAEVNGGKMEWYYKSVGSGREDQIRAY